MSQKELSEEELIEKINVCSQIIDGLADYRPFQMLLEHYKQNIVLSDATWHQLGTDETKRMNDLRVLKLAGISFINCLDDFRHDRDVAKDQLNALRNPDTIQTSYIDNE